MQETYHKGYYLLSNFINQSMIVLLPILALKFFQNENFVAKLGFYETFAGLAFGIFSIVIVDRIKNKQYLLIATFLLVTSLCLFEYFADINNLIFTFIMILFIFLGRLITSIQNAIMFKEYSLKGDRGLEKYNSFTNSSLILINIFSPPISVYLYFNIGFTYLIVISVVLLLFSLFFSNKQYTIKVRENIFLNFSKNIKFFFKNKDIYSPLLIIASVIFSGIMVTTIYYLYIIKTLHMNNQIYTFLLAIQSIGSLLSASYAYQRFFTKKIKLLPMLIGVFALLYYLFLLSKDRVFLLFLFAFLLGFIMTLVIMIANEQYQKNCPPDMFGSINGVKITINNTAGLIGAGIGSFMYIKIGAYGVYLINIAILSLITILSYIFYTKKLKETENE